MKKFYFASTLVILALSAAFIGYGMYLNVTSESYIGTMLASRAVSLSGLRVSYRELRPEILIRYAAIRTRMQADVAAQIDGTIDELYITQGQEVERDQPIVRIVNDDVPLMLSRANADIAKAEASYLQYVSTAERNRRLAAEDAISTSELEMSISQMDASKAELDAAKIARRQVEQQRGFQIVTSPLPGSVLVVYRQPGNYVSKGMPVAMIVDFSKMYFTALIDDERIKNIAPLDGKFSLLLNIGNMTEKAFDSTARASFSEDTAFGIEISNISPPLSEDAPVRSVTFEIDNHLGVMEFGLYTDLVIRKNTSKRALAIPLAVISDRDDPKVYVSDADSNLAVRGIRLGSYDSRYVEVLEGLSEGDIIITSGVEGLDLGMKIDVNPEESM